MKRRIVKHDTAVTYGFKFCQYHIAQGHSKQDVMETIASLYDFEVDWQRRLREREDGAAPMFASVEVA